MSQLSNYYDELREQYGYASVDVPLGGMSTAEVRQRFAFADNLDPATVDSAEDIVISTGITVTGSPHVGTLGQLLTTLALRNAGFDVRAVFADLIAYHIHGVSIEKASALAERYREFALTLGFEPDSLSIQSEASDVLYTAQLLARYHEFDESDAEEEQEQDEDTPEPPAFEVALTDAYDAVGESPIKDDGTVEPTKFGRQHADHLLVADQLHPLVTGEDETVIVVLGADNHRLTAGIRTVLDRSPYSGTLVGLYTRLIRGYNGYPKLSKSIPESRFVLDAPSKHIREQIVNVDETYDRPANSRVFQMMSLASSHSAGEIDSLRTDGDAWKRAKHEYAEWLVDVGNAWKATRR